MNRINQFVKSFTYALRGLRYVVNHEKNFQNQLLAAFIIIFVMIYLQVTRAEAVVILVVVSGVLVMELFNTVVEKVVDILKPKIHPYARLIKDLMAASVLLASVLAVTIGILIFYPYVFDKLH
ncbi:MAG TPA: diacylglycerol kinase family protein [Patescibacteria group bacterium]|nr:diacylglycerol kinase family protein [Patescibacteria group bacterium]